MSVFLAVSGRPSVSTIVADRRRWFRELFPAKIERKSGLEELERIADCARGEALSNRIVDLPPIAASVGEEAVEEASFIRRFAKDLCRGKLDRLDLELRPWSFLLYPEKARQRLTFFGSRSRRLHGCTRRSWRLFCMTLRLTVEPHDPSNPISTPIAVYFIKKLFIHAQYSAAFARPTALRAYRRFEFTPAVHHLDRPGIPISAGQANEGLV